MRSLAVLLCALLLASAATADTAGHPVSLWLVEGERNKIYLLGSVHMLRKTDYPLPSVLESAYEDADLLMMEIDMDDLDPAAAQALVTRLGVIHDDGTLRELMGADLYADAERAAAGSGSG